MRLIPFPQPATDRLLFINPEHVIGAVSVSDDRTQIITVAQACTNISPIIELPVLDVVERLMGVNG